VQSLAEEGWQTSQSVSASDDRGIDHPNGGSGLPVADAASPVGPVGTNDSSAAADEETRSRGVRQGLQRAAEDLCPLADRFGRVLIEAAPLLVRYSGVLAAADRAAAAGMNGTSSSTERADGMPDDYFPAPEHRTHYNLLEFSLASMLRPR
jgi:hypothetical protein